MDMENPLSSFVRTSTYAEQQRDRATLHVSEYFAKSFKIIRNDTGK